MKINLNYQKYAAVEFFFQGTQERVRTSRGKRAISVGPIEVLLYTIIESCSTFPRYPRLKYEISRKVQVLHWVRVSGTSKVEYSLSASMFDNPLAKARELFIAPH